MEIINFTRERGEQRTRWMGSIESGLREIKAKIWRKKAEDRREYTNIIKEAEVLRNLRNQSVSCELNISYFYYYFYRFVKNRQLCQ